MHCGEWAACGSRDRAAWAVRLAASAGSSGTHGPPVWPVRVPRCGRAVGARACRGHTYRIRYVRPYPDQGVSVTMESENLERSDRAVRRARGNGSGQGHGGGQSGATRHAVGPPARRSVFSRFRAALAITKSYSIASTSAPARRQARTHLSQHTIAQEPGDAAGLHAALPAGQRHTSRHMAASPHAHAHHDAHTYIKGHTY